MSEPSQKELFRLDGKTAIVTGGGSGIGRAIVHRFAASGAAVHILDVDPTAGGKVVQEVLAANSIASYSSCDVTDQSHVKAVFASIFGKQRVDILVNNAGISHVGTLETTTEQDFDKILQVNVKGFYNCMQAVVGHMKANGGGVILKHGFHRRSGWFAGSVRLFGKQGRGARDDLFCCARLFGTQNSM